MTNITKIIDDKAKECVKDAASGLTVLPGEQWRMFVDGYLEGFPAGASFATTSPDILREILKSFCEFIANLDGEQKLFLIDHDWYWDLDKEGDAPISSEQLADRYIQHLQTNKPKEDARP